MYIYYWICIVNNVFLVSIYIPINLVSVYKICLISINRYSIFETIEKRA